MTPLGCHSYDTRTIINRSSTVMVGPTKGEPVEKATRTLSRDELVVALAALGVDDPSGVSMVTIVPDAAVIVHRWEEGNTWYTRTERVEIVGADK